MSNINDFVIENGVLKKYTGSDSVVRIPEGVTVIAEAAFYQSEIVEVAMSNSVIEIGPRAFSTSKKIKKVILTDAVEVIGDDAFNCCESIDDLVFGNSVREIGNGAFYGCKSLKRVRLPEHITKIPRSAFGNCFQLENITIPQNVKTICGSAFSGCRSLKEVILPDSIVNIGESVYGGAWAFAYCTSLERITIPKNVKRIEYRAFFGCENLKEVIVEADQLSICDEVFRGCKSLEKLEFSGYVGCGNAFDKEMPGLKIFIPRGMYSIKSAISINMLPYIVVDQTTDFATLWIYQSGKTWDAWFEKQTFDACEVLEAIGDLLRTQKKITPKQIARLQEFGEKFSVVDHASGIVEGLSDNIKTTAAVKPKEAKNTVSSGSNIPLEEICRKEFAVSTIEALIKKANINAKDLSGVCYKNSTEKASEFVVMCAIAPYLEIMKERPKKISGYKRDYLGVKFCESADKIVAELDRATFVEILGKALHINKVHEKPQRLIPLCRFGTREQIKEIISYIGKWDEWNRYSSSGRSTIIVARGALMLSDAREAMLYLEKCKLLREYAKLRGMDEESMRDNVLADFGFDENGKITFDLGSTTLDVSMAQDLTLSIYDVTTGKVVKSIPKKGTDADKYEKVSAQFNEIKANVKKVVKSRNDMLFEEFLSGKTRSASSWQSSYLKNPILHKVAELIVWKHGKNYFTLSASGAVDPSNNPYEIGESGQIGVAHPMEMKTDEVKAWQSYFISRGLKQPFEQIWEPVIDEKSLKEDRYLGLPIPFYRFRGQIKHGIEVYDSDFHNEISITLYGFKSEVLRLDWVRHSIDVNHRFEIKSIEPYGNFSRSHNHLIAYLDKCTIYGRIKNDDASVVDLLDSFTLAQVMDFIKFANENNCTNVTAAIMAYKNAHYGNGDVMDEFVL